jgi:phosphate transport system protein
MSKHFEASLDELKEQLLRMGGYVERAVEHATQALQVRDTRRLAEVHEIEKEVNKLHIAIDEACLKLLALQQPMAADLRLIFAVLKINTDLERMGDQAVNIAGNAARYLNGPAIKPLIDLPQMATEVSHMVRETLNAFVKRDEKLAREVLRRDDLVDAFKNKIFRDVLEHLKKSPGDIEQGLNLILIARNMERIGDHATNIAEDVIFAVTGEDVRHAARIETIKEALQ